MRERRSCGFCSWLLLPSQGNNKKPSVDWRLNAISVRSSVGARDTFFVCFAEYVRSVGGFENENLEQFRLLWGGGLLLLLWNERLKRERDLRETHTHTQWIIRGREQTSGSLRRSCTGSSREHYQTRTCRESCRWSRVRKIGRRCHSCVGSGAK